MNDGLDMQIGYHPVRNPAYIDEHISSLVETEICSIQTSLTTKIEIYEDVL